MSRETYTYKGDRRERGRRPVEAQEHTIASAKHPERNEDAALGDVERLQAETANPPELGDPNHELVQRHQEAISTSAEREMAAADKLKERGVFGVFDGVSGKEAGMGAGVVASRIASGTIAERMAQLPPDADVNRTKETIRDAIVAANTDVGDYKRKNPEFAKALDQMGCTADVLRSIDNGDGTHEIAYGHAGDGRIYVLDGETGKLRQETRDDSAVQSMVEAGKITEREAELITQADRNDLDSLHQAIPDKNPQFLDQLVKYRQAIVKSVSGAEMEPTVGSFTVKEGDKVLVSSDGIHDNLPEERIAEIMRAGGGAKELAEEAHARAGGTGGEKAPDAKGPDDITLQVLEFGGEQKERAAGREAGTEVTPENFDRAVGEAKMKLDALPSPEEVGKEEHDRQKYEVLRELTAYLTSQLNAENDPAKRERAASVAEELAGAGPEKRQLDGLNLAVMRKEAEQAGRDAPPMIDMRGQEWMARFEEAGWTPEQVKDWIDQRRKEIDVEARTAMEDDPSLKRLVEAHRDLKEATKELRDIGKAMEQRQEAKDQSALEKARAKVAKAPVMMLDAEETREMQAEIERIKQEEAAKKQEEQEKKKKSWWKFWK